MREILEDLLSELARAHEKSSIKKLCLEEQYEWHYSLITTTLEKGGPLILGFNWGASQNEEYEAQASISKCNFAEQDIGSLSRIIPFCKKYYGPDFLTKTSQSNYCFFRSKSESQISDDDIKLCEPIFEKMLDAIQPSSILCFSSKLRSYLLNSKRLGNFESKSISYKRGSIQMTYEAIRATLPSGIGIKFLPHPNYPMKGAARAAAWEFCCGNYSEGIID